MSDKFVDWNIGYLDREYAQLHGDPIIGVVKASSKQQAEQIAARINMGGVHGVWAWRANTESINEPWVQLKTN